MKETEQNQENEKLFQTFGQRLYKIIFRKD